MNQSDAQKIVIERISKLEPEHIAKKIIGFMYFKDLTDQEMIRLAYGPDTLIHDLIQEAKNARLLALSQSLVISPPIPPTINHAAHAPLSDLSFQFPPFSSLSPRPLSSLYRRIDPHWIDNSPVEQLAPPMHNSGFKYMGMEEPQEAIKPGPSSFPDNYYCPEPDFNNLSIRGIRNSANPMTYPVKACYYYNKGYCKHGTNCKYFHGESFHESYAQSFCPNLYEEVGEDPGFSPASLKKLELEIIGLLKARRGSPVSIASLPMMYYEKYGKTLQAEGYLTESQRHGKAGYSLTKLLARLKSIQVIDRPHGQHSVILVEDVAKYMDFRTKRNDPGPIVTDSRQIFLTFTADCEFTCEDVSNYFSIYGPVQDVRIPERTYGFVSFVSADTVKQILSMGNPHFVCGARVLVKPYREKSKLAERKYPETFDHAAYYQSHHTDLDLQTNWDSSSSISRRQLMEVQEHTIQLEAMRLSQLQLACNYMGTKSCWEHPKFAPTERFNYLFGLNGGSSTNDNLRYPINNCGDQESTQGVNLPDSPFAAAAGNNNVSAVI